MINYKGALGGLFKIFRGGNEVCVNDDPQEFEIEISINISNQDYDELYEPITFE